jgi:hypothetical protein
MSRRFECRNRVVCFKCYWSTFSKSVLAGKQSFKKNSVGLLIVRIVRARYKVRFWHSYFLLRGVDLPRGKLWTVFNWLNYYNLIVVAECSWLISWKLVFIVATYFLSLLGQSIVCYLLSRFPVIISPTRIWSLGRAYFDDWEGLFLKNIVRFACCRI